MKNLIVLFSIVFLLSLPAYAQNSIRDVDFKNFTYSPDFCGREDKRKITVLKGEFSEEKEVDGYTERVFFGVYGLIYGDLDGDKKDEAVILSVCNTGGTGNFTEAYIYKMRNGKPKRVMLLVGGDRADGGLREARIENKVLIVESNDAGEMGGACCPQYILTTRYRLKGKRLKQIGKTSKRKIYPEKRITFAKGKFGKTFMLKMSGDEQIKRFVIGAAKGQTLVVTKDNSVAKLRLWKGDAKVLEEETSLVAKLNKTGDYIFEISNFSDRSLEFEVTVLIKDFGDQGTTSSSNFIKSIYTDLNDKKCKTLISNPDEGGQYRGECDGVGGYKLEVLEGDLRQTIDVVHKQSGGKWELNLWSTVSPAFSYLGEKAEWRVKTVNGKTRPIALITRFNASEDPEDSSKVTSYLVVTKFDGEFVCVTNIVKPMRKQNEKARQFADVAATKPCYKRKRN